MLGDHGFGSATMRLSAREIEIIKASVAKVFGAAARIYLFGSRVDDYARGGDIDLLVELPGAVDDKLRKTLALSADIQESLGEQRIDIVIRDAASRVLPIHTQARRTGVAL